MKKKVQEQKRCLKNFVLKFLALGLIVFLAIILFTYHLAYLNKIYPGITIVQQPVGNLTIAQATNKLQNFLSEKTSPEIIIKDEQQEWKLDLAKAKFSYDLNQTVQKAYSIGRTGKPLADLQTKIKSWAKGINIELEYHLDQNELENQIATIAAQVFLPTIEPTIKVLPPTSKTSRITIGQGKEGQELDKRKLISLLNSQLANLNFQSLNLPLIKTSPLLTSQQIENTKQRAEKFLEKKMVLVDGEENRWELKDSDLIDFLSFTNGFEQEKIASWSANLASTINCPPQNAAFQFTEGKVVEFRPAKEGRNLDQKKTVDLIVQGMIQLEKGEKETTINLPITNTPPAVKTADVNSLGIKEMIGKGVSFFKGSIPSRVHNLKLASSKLNGVLIPPGENFSFNQTLGEVSKSTGYQEAYIIKEGRTILGDGGGVCQVSTTLFRAALNAGLPILERHAHAYRVAYYEQSSDPGLDATVFDPTADLKIKNDTPAYILIQTQVETQNSRLVIALYGTSDGRRATISKARVWDQVPPPPDLYQEDPTLPPGQIKQIDWKAWGAKVAFDYKVERNGEILQNRTFYSYYQPWQAVFLKGPLP
jgi:vancomycin resistance protein YoaR